MKTKKQSVSYKTVKMSDNTKSQGKGYPVVKVGKHPKVKAVKMGDINSTKKY